MRVHVPILPASLFFAQIIIREILIARIAAHSTRQRLGLPLRLLYHLIVVALSVAILDARRAP